MDEMQKFINMKLEDIAQRMENLSREELENFPGSYLTGYKHALLDTIYAVENLINWSN